MTLQSNSDRRRIELCFLFHFVFVPVFIWGQRAHLIPASHGWKKKATDASAQTEGDKSFPLLCDFLQMCFGLEALLFCSSCRCRNYQCLIAFRGSSLSACARVCVCRIAVHLFPTYIGRNMGWTADPLPRVPPHGGRHSPSCARDSVTEACGPDNMQSLSSCCIFLTRLAPSFPTWCLNSWLWNVSEQRLLGSVFNFPRLLPRRRASRWSPSFSSALQKVCV